MQQISKKICSTRWLENIDVCQQALDVYGNVKTYVEHSKLPDNFTVSTVKGGINDLLMPVKISFFESIASIIKPFLKIFRFNDPLAPFLHQELEKVMRLLMQNFRPSQHLN